MFSARDDSTGLRLVVGIPQEETRVYAAPVVRLITWMITLALCLTLIVSGVYAWLFFRPMFSLLDTFNAVQAANDAHGIPPLGRNMLLSLNADFRAWREEYQKAAELMSSHALRRALDGLELTPDERAILVEQKVFSAPYRLLCAVCLSGCQLDNRRAYATLRAYLEQELPGAKTYLASQLYTVLAADENLQTALDRLAQHMRASASIHMVFALSGAHDSIEALAACAQEINWLIYVAPQTEQDIIKRYGQPLTMPRSDGIPLQKYISLSDCVTRGDTARVTALFDEYAEYLSHGTLDTIHARRMLANIEDVLLQMARQIACECPPLREGHTTDMLLTLRERAIALCEQYSASRQPANENVDALMAYIEANFKNPQFDLTALAAHFGKSENYVSILIKKGTGINYSMHVETLRMRYAYEQLRAGGRSIDDIIRDAGYDNKSTFYKAFKRYWGVTPGSIQNGDEGKR